MCGGFLEKVDLSDLERLFFDVVVSTRRSHVPKLVLELKRGRWEFGSVGWRFVHFVEILLSFYFAFFEFCSFKLFWFFFFFVELLVRG